MSIYEIPKEANPDTKNVRKAYNTAAKVVFMFGDRYLPLFERLHQELQKAEASSDLKILALKVCQDQNLT